MNTLRAKITASVALGAALALPTQAANASVRDNGDRASESAPVCVWESKLAADQQDMNRGTCFTVGMHEDASHFFYNRMGDRYVEYVTIPEGYAADLQFAADGHGKTDSEGFRRSRYLSKGRTGLFKVYVHSTTAGRTHKEAKACVYKDKGWYDLYRRAYARCFPAGEYPDVSLPQFDALGWFNYLELSDRYQVILYTGKNFTGTATRVPRGGKIPPAKAGSKPPHPGRGLLPDWMFGGSGKAYQSIKIVRVG